MPKQDMQPGFEGGQADMTPASMISRTVAEANGIGMGKPASQGTEDNTVVAGATEFVGITVDEFFEGTEFEQYDQARLMVEGSIYVKAAGTVAAGDPVVYSSGWKTGGTAGTILDEARYDTSGSSGDLVVIRLWGTNITANS